MKTKVLSPSWSTAVAGRMTAFRGAPGTRMVANMSALRSVPRVGQDDAKLEGVGGGIECASPMLATRPVSLRSGIGGNVDLDLAAGLESGEIALEDVADDPDGVDVGDGGDGSGVIEGALHLAGGGADVEDDSGDGGAEGDVVGDAVFGEA